LNLGNPHGMVEALSVRRSVSIIHGMVEALSGRRSVEELLAAVDPSRHAFGFARPVSPTWSCGT
jgi:hypothetical protein